MGCSKFKGQTNVHLQMHIRDKSVNSANVLILIHASAQMTQRKVSRMEVLECLRKGFLKRKPEIDVDHGSLRCRMEHYIAGRNCMAIVALSDESADLIVVTVMSA